MNVADRTRMETGDEADALKDSVGLLRVFHDGSMIGV